MKSIILALSLVASVAQAQTDPSTLPRLERADLTYQGSFAVPVEDIGADGLSYGGQPIAFNPARKTLFVGTMRMKLAEITVPAPSLTAPPQATYAARVIVDPSEGTLRAMTADPVGSLQLYGLLPDGAKLHVGAAPFYDANNLQIASHFSRPSDLTKTGVSRWSQVWQPKRQGFVGGWMAWVPQEWRALLGGPAITGNGAIPIITRTSFGPSAFAFDPSQIGQPFVPATPLVYYPGDHPTLGSWGATEIVSPAFNMSTQIGGVVIVPGTRSAFFIGRTGIGKACYGLGTADKTKHETKDTDGTMFCYDPIASAKGSHAYPYRYQVYAYDLNDWAAVKAGKMQPWDVKPYALWPLEMVNGETGTGIGGVTYDADAKTIYFTQLQAHRVGCCAQLPLVHALKVNTAGGTQAPVPVPEPQPEPKPAPLPDPVEELRARIAVLEAQVNIAQIVADRNAAIARADAKDLLIQQAMKQTTAKAALATLTEALKK